MIYYKKAVSGQLLVCASLPEVEVFQDGCYPEVRFGKAWVDLAEGRFRGVTAAPVPPQIENERVALPETPAGRETVAATEARLAGLDDVLHIDNSIVMR